MKCGECGYENPVDSLFCEECGSSFALACAACQKENNSSAKFCRFCGESIEANSSPTVEPSDSEVAGDGQPSTQTITLANDESSRVVSSSEEIFQESSQGEGKETNVLAVVPVGFGEAIRRGFINYVVFKGRASKQEYWLWMLFVVLVSFLPFVAFAIIIPSISVAVRRLHDQGESGNKLIVMYAIQFGSLCLTVIGAFSLIIWTIIGFSIMLVSLIWWVDEMCQDGQEGTNKYGPDPRTTPR